MAGKDSACGYGGDLGFAVIPDTSSQSNSLLILNQIDPCSNSSIRNYTIPSIRPGRRFYLLLLRLFIRRPPVLAARTKGNGSCSFPVAVISACTCVGRTEGTKQVLSARLRPRVRFPKPIRTLQQAARAGTQKARRKRRIQGHQVYS